MTKYEKKYTTGVLSYCRIFKENIAKNMLLKLNRFWFNPDITLQTVPFCLFNNISLVIINETIW